MSHRSRELKLTQTNFKRASFDRSFRNATCDWGMKEKKSAQLDASKNDTGRGGRVVFENKLVQVNAVTWPFAFVLTYPPARRRSGCDYNPPIYLNTVLHCISINHPPSSMMERRCSL